MTTDLSHLDFEPDLRCEHRPSGPFRFRCRRQAEWHVRVPHAHTGQGYMLCDEHADLAYEAAEIRMRQIAIAALRGFTLACPECHGHLHRLADIIDAVRL